MSVNGKIIWELTYYGVASLYSHCEILVLM